SRFNIKTIDSFCAVLARQMPLLTLFGAQAQVQDDVGLLYREAVRELFAMLESSHTAAEDLAALLLHFDNDWERLQALLEAMLARREQWREYVGVHRAPEESEALLNATVNALIGGELTELSTLLHPCQHDLLELLRY